MIKNNQEKIMRKSLLIIISIVIIVAGLLFSFLVIKNIYYTPSSYISRTDPRYDSTEEKRIADIYRGERFLQGKYTCSFIAEDWKEHTAYFDFKDETRCNFDTNEYYYTIKGNQLKLTSIYTDTGNPIVMEIEISDDNKSFKCLSGVHKARTFRK